MAPRGCAALQKLAQAKVNINKACLPMSQKSPKGIRPKVYTVAEFAYLFATSPRIVRELIHKGEIPALKIGRFYRIPRRVADD
jgi:excisionase family DNA binding protein